MHTNTLPLKQQFEHELRENILPFWMKYPPDPEHGGFYGALTNDLQVKSHVERSAVLCSRILWTFSTAARLYNETAYLTTAKWAFDYLSTRFWDEQYQGIYWSLDQHGRPVNERKHVYAQAFSIYGLSAYYRLSGEPQSLALAQQLFGLVEAHAFDPIYGGYFEYRGRDWSELADMRLSNKDLNSAKSMNTLLHLLEAYTSLSLVWPDKKLSTRLEDLLHIFLDKVIDPLQAHQRLFFDRQWNSLSETISYGHDIETSWLVLEAAEVVNNPSLTAKVKTIALDMAQAVYDQALGPQGEITYESEPQGKRVEARHWWAHAEAVVGFYNAYQVSNQERFCSAAQQVWQYIQAHFVDCTHGDWFKLLTPAGEPILSQHKTGPWECPYHHARMCFEMARRLNSE